MVHFDPRVFPMHQGSSRHLRLPFIHSVWMFWDGGQSGAPLRHVEARTRLCEAALPAESARATRSAGASCATATASSRLFHAASLSLLRSLFLARWLPTPQLVDSRGREEREKERRETCSGSRAPGEAVPTPFLSHLQGQMFTRVTKKIEEERKKRK